MPDICPAQHTARGIVYACELPKGHIFEHRARYVGNIYSWGDLGQVVNNEKVQHPAHYGGADNPYEVIKIIEHYDLDFCLGNTIKYILRAGRKPGEDTITDLRKAAWYLNREIERLGPGSVSPLEPSK